MESPDTFDRRLAQERFLLVGFIAAACRGRVASSDVVEDLVQDTLAIAWTRRDEFDANTRRLMHRTQVKGGKPVFDIRRQAENPEQALQLGGGGGDAACFLLVGHPGGVI
jgi:hypothetical protein